MSERDDFTGRRVLVTGGTGGVGRAVAGAFAKRGADIAITYRSSSDAAAEVIESLQSRGTKAHAIQTDLADAKQTQLAVDTARQKLGGLDTLVHCAGAQVNWAPVRAIAPEEWGAFIETDLIGAYNAIQPALCWMHDNGGGCIVAISSIAAQMCQARNSQGAAAKAGLEALIRVIAREEGRYGVRANAVSIGLTDTAQARAALEQWGDEAAQKIVAGIPLGRMGDPDEIAEFIAYLTSEKGAYFTGKVIQIDGGQVIAG